MMSLAEAVLVKSFNREAIDSELIKKLFIADQLDQLKLFKDLNGNSIGYVCFALIDQFTLKNISINNGDILFPYEWNEGQIFFVVDYSYHKIMREIFFESFVDFTKDRDLIFYKINKVCKISSKRRFSKLMKIDYVLSEDK
ncbi:hypothetical protein [Cellvibrio sp. PSBB023]|uniref:hypothetical protein n=1 Tax=Cellvibrio sp. PSBB023 TaxID=1945512 RepID=UPI0009902203|nr:hypothetical protein [Cellvibrio sp. PSBB023]AQT60518.1 hypothetical protein B0D95_10775 [Cellvibrio sp. PSBB023]